MAKHDFKVETGPLANEAAHESPITQQPVTTAIRRLLTTVLVTHSDFDAFCLDHFHDVYDRFSNGMERTARLNLLLALKTPTAIVQALQCFDAPQTLEHGKHLFYLLEQAPQSSCLRENPYRGLAAFREEDTNLFFGRENLTERLWQAYRAVIQPNSGLRLLQILGPSGCGKSSVVSAGLLPVIRQWPSPVHEAAPCIITLTPGRQPIHNLARALILMRRELCTRAEPGHIVEQLRRMASLLREPNERGEMDGLDLFATTLSEPASARLAIVVDQLEEIYSQCSEPSERDDFVSLLLHAAASSSQACSVILVMRSDFLGMTNRWHPALGRGIASASLLVPPMGADELRSIISKPAHAAGRPLEEAAIERLLSETRCQESALPLLEFALTQIWDGLNASCSPVETLRKMGGLGGAVALRAQTIYDRLDQEERRIARRAFLAMAHLEEGILGVRRRVRLLELVAPTESLDIVRSVLERFATSEARLLSLSADGEDETDICVEVTHEALFNHWDAVQEWLTIGRSDLRIQRRADEAAYRWDAAGRPEGLLWRNPDLGSLQGLRKRASVQLTQRLLTFLECSEHHQDREKSANRQRQQLTEQLAGIYRTIAGVAIIVASMLGLLGWQLWRARQSAETQRLSSRAQLALARIEQGRQELALNGNPTRALAWFNEALKLDYDSPALRLMLGLAMNEAASAPRTLQSGPTLEAVSRISISENGQWAVTDAFPGGKIKLWNLTNGQVVQTISSQGAIEAISADTMRLVTQGEGRYFRDSKEWPGEPMKVWDTRTGKLVTVLQNSYLSGSSLGPEGLSYDSMNFAVFDTRKRVARVWNFAIGQELYSTRSEIACQDPLIYINNNVLICGIFKTILKVFDLKTGLLLQQLNGNTGVIQNIALSSDGRYILTASDDKTARLWDVRSGKQLLTLQHPQSVTRVAFSKAGSFIWTKSASDALFLWNRSNGTLLTTFRAHSKPIIALAFNHDDTELLTASDSEIRLWNINNGRLILEQSGALNKVALGFSDTAPLAVTVSDDNTLELQHIKIDKRMLILPAHDGKIVSVAFSPDSERIATTSIDRVTKIWDIKTGSLLRALPKQASPVLNVAFNNAGTHIVTGGAG